MKNIDLILKNTREDLDLTQIEVMNLTGINNKTLSGYENGVSEPDLETFAKLMNLYNLSADEVLEIKRERGKDRQNASLTPTEQRLLGYFRSLSPSRQDDILVMLSALTQKNN